jgi:hypothetical protein
MSAVTRVVALMLFRLTILLSLMLALAGCQRESYSRSISGFSSADKKVLYDFRAESVTPSLPNAATTRKVLSAIFPAYLSDARQCKSGGAGHNAGQIVPVIRGSADGSFTAAGLKQTVYLIDVAECGVRPPVSTTHRLVVFATGTLAANVEAPRANAIAGAYDLDGDGKQELLLGAGGSGPERQIKTARLVEFDKDKLVTVEDFGQTYDNFCAVNAVANSLRASLVYYFPPPAGQKPKFIVELYRAQCPLAGEKPHWERSAG